MCFSVLCLLLCFTSSPHASISTSRNIGDVSIDIHHIFWGSLCKLLALRLYCNCTLLIFLKISCSCIIQFNYHISAPRLAPLLRHREDQDDRQYVHGCGGLISQRGYIRGRRGRGHGWRAIGAPPHAARRLHACHAGRCGHGQRTFQV
jgi:hypothetical protein